MFKNLITYRFNKPFPIIREGLESAISEFSFSPCGSQDISKFGFSCAFGKLGTSLVEEYDGRYLICATKEEKILPAQVIRDALSEKIDQIESEEVRKLSKKERDALKDDIVTNLLPRAFSRKSTIKALIAPSEGKIFVDASSSSKAEELLSLLRKAMGSLPVIPAGFKSPIELTLTEWLKKGTIPAGFEVQDEATLKSDSSEGGVAKFSHQDLAEEEVLAHIETGKQVHKISINFGRSLSFNLQSDGSVKRLRFSEEFMSKNDDVGTDSKIAKMDADFALTSCEIVAMTSALDEALGGLEDTL